MSEGDPQPDDTHAAVATLRAASSRVAELDTDTTDTTGPADPADPADTAPGAGPGPALDPHFDVAEHAERFEELHDALTSVLATLDRT